MIPSRRREGAVHKLCLLAVGIGGALGVVGLGVVLAFLATIGDDVGNSLPPAGEASPGD